MGFSLCRRFWNQICTERGVIPSIFANAWRWSKLGRGSSSKELMSTESCSLEILQRFGLRPPSSPSRGESPCKVAVSPEDQLLEGDDGARPEGGAPSSTCASRSCGIVCEGLVRVDDGGR